MDSDQIGAIIAIATAICITLLTLYFGILRDHD